MKQLKMQNDTETLYWQIKFHKIVVTYDVLFQKTEQILVDLLRKYFFLLLVNIMAFLKNSMELKQQICICVFI